jgi:hypothetical protein
MKPWLKRIGKIMGTATVAPSLRPWKMAEEARILVLFTFMRAFYNDKFKSCQQ